MDLKALLREKREGNRMDGSLLKGCADMYRATGEREWRDAVLHTVSACVFPEEELKERESIKEIVSRGKALFFAWDETGEERYKTAAGKLRDALRNFTFSTPRELYAIQPFIAEYDTRFGDKQSYKTIAREFAAACREEKNEDDPFLLAALVDTAEKMDMQIYEHYRTLADLFLSRARGVFSRQTALEPDAAGNAMVVYAMLKGVRLGFIDEEKYLPFALRVATALKAACAAAGEHLGWRLMMEAEVKEAEKR